MILAIDVGNTNIVFGGVDKHSKISFLCRISTDTNKTDDEYAVQLKTLIDLNGVTVDSFEGGIISSVGTPRFSSPKATSSLTYRR